MPRTDCFSFFLYRLNKIVRTDLFAHRQGAIYSESDDIDIKSYLSRVCVEAFDVENQTRRTLYRWSLRGFVDLSEEYSYITLARSEVERETSIVTSDRIVLGNSVANPPSAETIGMLIFWPRHLVVVENHSGMTTGETWLKYFDKIMQNALYNLDSRVVPTLEAIPVRGSILRHFELFDKVYRFKVKVRLPNPDLNRWARLLHSEMLENRIQEYLQDMYSPVGLKVDEDSRAHSTAAMAELGYKSGGARIVGEKDGHQVDVEEGKNAIKGRIDNLRSLIRGLGTNARSARYAPA